MIVAVKIEDVQTPALLLNVDALERNLGRMAELARAGKVALRPHAKTHKSPWVAQRQLAHGAVGICTAKIGEAEVMARAGVRDILITTEAVPRNMDRLIALATFADVTPVVDDPEMVDELGRRARARGVSLPVLVDVNVGQNRTGVDVGPALSALVAVIGRTRGLRLVGIQGYEGHAQLVRESDARRKRAWESFDKLATARQLLADAGFEPMTLTTAGTGTFRFAIEHGTATEIQPGSYTVMDATYASVEPAFENAIFILTSVVSVDRGDTLIIDAGWKAVSTDSGMPVIRDHPEASYQPGGDEHGKVAGLAGPHHSGDVMWLVPSHCDTTINLYDRYVVIRDDGHVEGELPVATRGRIA